MHPSGPVTQLNCVNETGTGGCVDGRSLLSTHGLTMADDNGKVVVASAGSNAVAIFEKNTNGSLIQFARGSAGAAAGCVSDGGSGGQCLVGHGLLAPMDVAATGGNLYVASFGSDAVDILAKDKGSRLFKQDGGTAGCISETGSGGCTDGFALTGASSLALGPKGSGLYVGGDHSIAIFSRSKTNGNLTETGCINDDGSNGCTDGYIPGTVSGMATTRDGKSLLAVVSGPGEGALLVLNRINGLTPAGCFNDDGANGCTDSRALNGPQGVAVDGTGANVYVASNGSGALAVFNRDKTGALTQPAGTAGCLNETGAETCLVAPALANAHDVVVYTNGKWVGVTSDAGFTTFNRSKKGVLTVPAAPTGCMTSTGSGGACAVGNGLAGAWGVAVTGAKKLVYLAGSLDDSVAALVRGT